MPLVSHHFFIVGEYHAVLKGYCTRSRINCGMAKLLAHSRACEGLLASDLAIPQLILERVK